MIQAGPANGLRCQSAAPSRLYVVESYAPDLLPAANVLLFCAKLGWGSGTAGKVGFRGIVSKRLTSKWPNDFGKLK